MCLPDHLDRCNRSLPERGFEGRPKQLQSLAVGFVLSLMCPSRGTYWRFFEVTVTEIGLPRIMVR